MDNATGFWKWTHPDLLGILGALGCRPGRLEEAYLLALAEEEFPAAQPSDRMQTFAEWMEDLWFEIQTLRGNLASQDIERIVSDFADKGPGRAWPMEYNWEFSRRLRWMDIRGVEATACNRDEGSDEGGVDILPGQEDDGKADVAADAVDYAVGCWSTVPPCLLNFLGRSGYSPGRLAKAYSLAQEKKEAPALRPPYHMLTFGEWTEDLWFNITTLEGNPSMEDIERIVSDFADEGPWTAGANDYARAMSHIFRWMDFRVVRATTGQP